MESGHKGDSGILHPRDSSCYYWFVGVFLCFFGNPHIIGDMELNSNRSLNYGNLSAQKYISFLPNSKELLIKLTVVYIL